MRAVKPIVQAARSAAPVLQTTAGRMAGRTLEFADGFRVNTFLGVPFAAPPCGPLRFEKPLPPLYSAMRQTIEMPEACHKNEDCLKINLFVPEPFDQHPTKRPLLLFIPGGGFDRSSSAAHSTKYVADHFCRQGVVYAVVQYRVGVCGFGSDGTEAFAGNYAMWDVVQALKFLREHAETIGFDPNRITCAGHSAGSAMVSALTLSPHSNKLFAQAIQFSGSAFSLIASGNIVQRETRKMVERLSSGTAVGNPKEFLRKFSFNDLQCVYKRIGPPMDGASVLRFSPRVDGDFLPADYPQLLAEAPPKPTLNTNSRNEGVVFALFNYLESCAEVKPEDARNFDEFAFRRKIRDLFVSERVCGERAAEGVERIFRFYAGANPSAGSRECFLDRYTTAIHDLYFGVPVQREMREKLACGWPVFQGAFERPHFAMQPPDIPLVATHGTEYLYLFGHLKDAEALFDEADRKYRDFWIDSIVQFVKSGDPRSDRTPEWRPATPADPALVLRVDGERPPRLERRVMEEETKFWTEMSELANFDLIRQLPLNGKE